MWWLLATATLVVTAVGGVAARGVLAGNDDESVTSGRPPAETADPTSPTAPPAPSTPPPPDTTLPAPPPAPPFPQTRRATPELTSALRGRSVFVAGDSLTVQTMAHGWGDDAPADLEVQAGLGWTAANVQPALDEHVATTPVGTLIVALGTNDSSLVGADGWTPDDVARFRQLISTPGPSACVVLVLPGHGPSIDPAYAAELDEARAALQALAWERGGTPGAGPTVVVDWQSVIDRRPTLISGDGIHLSGDLATGTASATSSAARTDLYWQGTSQCQDA